ncbi:MAG: PfkB family carbohydrate kinase [Planctomycetota bacterium]|nr:PfkB family carbohydrate kinase [Planctomycetota bacterium]
MDTVGAGDCFNGCLAAYLAGRADLLSALPSAIRFAVAGAAISVTRHGAQPSMPRRAEILKLLGSKR